MNPRDRPVEYFCDTDHVSSSGHGPEERVPGKEITLGIEGP